MIDSIPRPAIAAPRQRSAESPTLWMLLLAGSMLLHIALFLSLRSVWVEQVGGQGGDSSIAIELVDSKPDTESASLPPKASSLKAVPIAPAAITAAPPVALPENDQEIQAPPRSTQPTLAPSPTPSTSSSFPPNSPLQGQPKANSKPSLVSPSQPEPTPKPTPEPTPLPVQPTPPLVQTSPGLLRSGEILPSAPVRSNQSGGESATIAPDAVRTTVQPVIQGGGGLRMTIVSAPRAINVDRDLPDEPLQLLSPRDLSFPQFPLPPCIRRSSGKLTLVLVIDRYTGKPKAEQLDNGLVCDASVAKLIRENIQFQPASQAGGRVEGQVQIELQLTPL